MVHATSSAASSSARCYWNTARFSQAVSALVVSSFAKDWSRRPSTRLICLDSVITHFPLDGLTPPTATAGLTDEGGKEISRFGCYPDLNHARGCSH